MAKTFKLAYSHLSGIDTYAAAPDNPHLRNGLERIIRQVNAITAGQQTFNTDTGTQAAPAPPAAGDFTVTGLDGKFIVDITNPQDITPISQAVLNQNAAAVVNQTGQPILYQLRSADDEAMTVNVTTYDPDAAIHREFQLPNLLKFWQMRSTFDDSTFNSWQYFMSAATCGPVQVWSGLQRSQASGLVDSATTPEGTNPLTQSGATMTISVAASVFTAGDQGSISYGSGSVTPASYGTWLVYALDQYRKGGTVTYIATQNSSDITSSLYAVYFGKITTASGGGGSGSGGGGGTCCRAGVPYRKFDGTDADCSTLETGDLLMGADGGPEVIQQIDVLPARPCFHLEFDTTGKLTKKEYLGDFTVYRIHLDRSHTFLAGANGIIDGACSEHIIQYAGGGFTDVFGAVVGETFSLNNGACGSHNVQKI